MHLASTWPRLARCLSTTFASPRLGGPRRLRYLFTLPHSRARRSIQRSSPRPSLRESASSVVAVCSRSAARPPTSGRLRSTTVPVMKLQTAFLATGKHDLRGHGRPKNPHQWVAFKMYYRLSPAQTADLEDASELTLYSGGYGGIQPVEDGIANFCCVVKQRYFARAGLRWESLIAKMQQDCPHLAMRLDGAESLLDKPIAITHIPYGYIRRTTEDGLYCVGDQAAVIPSFTGDGISIALHTARRAAAAYLAAEPAPVFQTKLRFAMLPQMRLAEFAANGLNNSLARAVLPFCLRVWPGAMRVTARLTRVTQPAAIAPQAFATEIEP